MKRSRPFLGFTLIELILVMFIMTLLTFMMVPKLSQFVKGTRVQQTVSIVTTTLYRARMEALRTRKMVGVFFGDDLTLCKTQPTPGVLPQKGRIEIWTVKDNYVNNPVDSSGSGSTSDPFNPAGWWNPGDWYPYRYPDTCLTAEPATFPDGVRVLSGWFFHGTGPPAYQFGWPAGPYMATPDGEIKRHTITYNRAGSLPGGNTYWDVLIFDEQTGEHAIIVAGEWLISAKPRVLPFQLTGLIGVSNTYYPIAKNIDIASNCEK